MLNREKVLNKSSIINQNGFNFEELYNISKINLRGNAFDKEFINNTSIILNLTIPTEPNTSKSNNELKIIWLSPNEWLIKIYEKNKFDEIFLNLNRSLNSQNTAVTDITENRTILRLSGEYLYKLLSKFMIIDFDEVLKKESAVAQTIFVKVPVLIVRNHQQNEKERLDLYANRSHAQYIINLLIDGSKNIDF